MRKCLLLLFVSMIAVSAFAGPVAPPLWDKPLHKAVVFDPYVTDYGAYVIGTFNSPNYAVNIQVEFDQEVGVPYYAVVQVYGIWASQPGGASYKQFTILFNSSQWYKSVNFPMAPSEEAYTSLVDLIDYGPQ